MVEGAVARTEVQGRVPVVGEVLAERARRAATLGTDVPFHSRCEGVPADNGVHVRRGNLSGHDERVKTLDRVLCAAETHHGAEVLCVGEGGRQGDQGNQLHSCEVLK